MNLENAMVMRNGYGISDTQDQEGTKDYPVEDIMGTEIQDGDVYYVINEDEVVLEENLVEYFKEFYDAEKRVAGE